MKLKVIREITIDVVCKEILTRIGILDRFTEHGPHGIYCGIFKAKIDEVPSFVLASNQWGHAKQEDNGYFMLCLPQSQWDAGEAAAMFGDWMLHAVAPGSSVQSGTFTVPDAAA